MWGVLADEVPDSVRRREHPTGRLVFAGHRVPVWDEPLLDRVTDAARDNSRCGQFRREFGDRVAAVDCGEGLKLNTPEHGVTYYETGFIN